MTGWDSASFPLDILEFIGEACEAPPVLVLVLGVALVALCVRFLWRLFRRPEVAV